MNDLKVRRWTGAFGVAGFEEASTALASSRGSRLFNGRDGCGSYGHDGKTGSDETNPSWCTSDDHQADNSKGEQRHHRYPEP